MSESPISLRDETGVERFRGTQSPGGGSQPIVSKTVAVADLVPNPNFAGRLMARLLASAPTARFLNLLALDVLEAWNDSQIGAVALGAYNNPAFDDGPIDFGANFGNSASPDLTTVGPVASTGTITLPTFMVNDPNNLGYVRLPSGYEVWLDVFGLAGDGTTGSLRFQFRIDTIAA